MAILPESEQLPKELCELIEQALLASARNPFDAIERAPQDVGNRVLRQYADQHKDWSLLCAYPLGPELAAVSQLWRDHRQLSCVVASSELLCRLR